MTSLVVEKHQFEAHCPFGVDAESEIFNALYHYFEQAYLDLTSELLDYSLGEVLPSILKEENEGELAAKSIFVNFQPISSIHIMVYEYVCKRAMYLAIPSLDLVLTNNGFGVVNARDIVPAIPERVNRLRQQCYNDADLAFDQLLKALPANSLTHDLIVESASWQANTRHLVWTARDFTTFCCPMSGNEPLHNRDALRRASGKLTNVENWMADLIGQDQFYAFRDMIRCSIEADKEQEIAIKSLLNWLSDGYSSGITDSRHGYNLLNYMDENIEHFPLYKESKQYATRHKEKFETTKKDGWFFFG